MKVCRLLLLIAVFAMSTNILAQQSRFKNERRIYLWDVTLSMKGFKEKTPDIYDKVITALEKDINSIIDEQTEIWVLPFQTYILERWNVKATITGKKEIIGKIKTFDNKDVTNTNITVPMTEVMNSLIKPDKRNVLILLTDGEQNAKNYPLETLLDVIRQWCDFAEKNDAYAFYVMLTQFAKNDRLIEAIDGACRMYKGEGTDFNFVELLPQDNIKYNIKDDMGKKIPLKVDCKKRVTIPEDLKIRCYCEPNPYMDIDQLTVVKNGMIELELKPKQNYDSLKQVLPIDTNEKIILHFDVENEDLYPLVSLLNKECSLELINKPEKILKVYVKD